MYTSINNSPMLYEDLIIRHKVGNADAIGWCFIAMRLFILIRDTYDAFYYSAVKAAIRGNRSIKYNGCETLDICLSLMNILEMSV